MVSRLLKLRKRGKDDWIVDITSYLVITIFALMCLFPFAYVVSTSFMPYSEYIENPLKMIPSRLDFKAYKQILSIRLIYTGYASTLFITIVGTFINIFLLIISAYPLTKKDLKGRKIIMTLIVFTMFFNGGMIPNYLVVRELGLINSLWSQIWPTAISAFNLILMKNFISGSIPNSLIEAAVIDGASEVTVLRKIIIPLSKPAIATFTIFCSVGHWNDFFTAIMYLTKRELWPLSVVLRELIIEDVTGMTTAMAQSMNESSSAPSFTLKMAVIVVATVPIIIVYPFLQKYFVKGIFIGSVKE